MELGETLEARVADRLSCTSFCPSHQLLSANAVPTIFDETGDLPVMVAGENARYVDERALKNGAILDAEAARILMSRGIDTGLTWIGQVAVERERFCLRDADVCGVADGAIRAMRCAERARVLSRFLPTGDVASYIYENEQGRRFFVLGYDLFRLCGNYGDPRGNVNFFNSYYRQEQLVEVIEWLSGTKLPAVCLKHPNLYLLTSSDGRALSVALFNVHLDDVLSPVILLDRAYASIRFVNCKGRLEGDRVYLSDIPPYGVAAFEVQ